MVLRDNLEHFGRQAILLAQHQAIPHMRSDDGGGHRGIGRIMNIARAYLIFLEIKGPFQLADVMVIPADTGQQGIGAHCFG